MNSFDKEIFVQKFSTIPGSFLCDLEYLNRGEVNRSYNEGLKENSNEIYSDLVFFYMYTCFFQTSERTSNFGPKGILLYNFIERKSFINIKKFYHLRI